MNIVTKTIRILNRHRLYKCLRYNNTCLPSNYLSKRRFATDYVASKSLKVTICGAAGNLGQPLSLLLKQCPLFDEIALYDIAPVCGIGTELGHVDTSSLISAYQGIKSLKDSLKDAKIVLILASAPIMPTMTVKSMFDANAQIICEIGKACAAHCPKALIGVVTTPINCIVPMISEIFKQCGCYDPNKIFGITTLDSVRANTMVAKVACLEPEGVVVPVVGGQSEDTIIPVLSQTNPCLILEPEEVENITNAVKTASNDIHLTRYGQSTPALSCAFAVARFTISLAKALNGEKDIVETAFVRSDVVRECKYFASPVVLGPEGVQLNWGLPSMNKYESCILGSAIKNLQKHICYGESYVRKERVCKPDCVLDCPEDKKMMDRSKLKV